MAFNIRQIFTALNEVGVDYVGNPVRSLDIFVKEPLPFDALTDASVAMDIDGTIVRVASIGHLILMKQAAGRARDLDDIAKLKQIEIERRANDDA